MKITKTKILNEEILSGRINLTEGIRYKPMEHETTEKTGYDPMGNGIQLYPFGDKIISQIVKLINHSDNTIFKDVKYGKSENIIEGKKGRHHNNPALHLYKGINILPEDDPEGPVIAPSLYKTLELIHFISIDDNPTEYVIYFYHRNFIYDDSINLDALNSLLPEYKNLIKTKLLHVDGLKFTIIPVEKLIIKK